VLLDRDPAVSDNHTFARIPHQRIVVAESSDLVKVAYVDCFSGLSGDIFIGAMLDAGLPLALLRRTLAALPVKNYALASRRVMKGSVRCTKFDVRIRASRHGHAHRHARDILRMIRTSELPPWTCARALEVFTRLAEIEGRIHGVEPAHVEFHELGAVDSIVDVVGACAALEIFGIRKVYCSRVPFAGGVIHGAHGLLPSPGPAAVGLLKGFPLTPVDVQDEIVTPTGAALLSALVERPGHFPPMTLEAVGYGAGAKEIPGRPNFSRILIGEAAEGPTADVALMLETNLDDATGQTVGYAFERLLEAGATDVFTTPVQMKKNRPGVRLSVLARPEQVAALERILLRETSAFGVRRYLVERTKLDRRIETVSTRYGKIRVKVGSLDGAVLKAGPEYEDVRRAAARHNVPLRTVADAAVRAFEQAPRR
jgi:uncharacterized protein (TIGR00299 family) protein